MNCDIHCIYGEVINIILFNRIFKIDITLHQYIKKYYNSSYVSNVRCVRENAYDVGMFHPWRHMFYQHSCSVHLSEWNHNEFKCMCYPFSYTHARTHARTHSRTLFLSHAHTHAHTHTPPKGIEGGSVHLCSMTWCGIWIICDHNWESSQSFKYII